MMNNSDAGEVLDVFCYLLCLGCKAGGPGCQLSQRVPEFLAAISQIPPTVSIEHHFSTLHEDCTSVESSLASI